MKRRQSAGQTSAADPSVDKAAKHIARVARMKWSDDKRTIVKNLGGLAAEAQKSHQLPGNKLRALLIATVVALGSGADALLDDREVKHLKNQIVSKVNESRIRKTIRALIREASKFDWDPPVIDQYDTVNDPLDLVVKFDMVIMDPRTAESLDASTVGRMVGNKRWLRTRWLEENPDEEYGEKLVIDALKQLEEIHNDNMYAAYMYDEMSRYDYD